MLENTDRAVHFSNYRENATLPDVPTCGLEIIKNRMLFLNFVFFKLV